MATKPKTIAKKAPEKPPVRRRVEKPVASPEKSAAGRKTKRTPEIQAMLIEALKDGCTKRAACAFAGISESEFYEWQSECAEFKETIVRAENQAEAGFTRVLKRAAEEGDWKAAESWLKRRRKVDWSERQEVTGADGKDVSMPTVVVLPSNTRDANNDTA